MPRWIVKGVDRETGNDRDAVLDAVDEAAATAAANILGVMVSSASLATPTGAIDSSSSPPVGNSPAPDETRDLLPVAQSLAFMVAISGHLTGALGTLGVAVGTLIALQKPELGIPIAIASIPAILSSFSIRLFAHIGVCIASAADDLKRLNKRWN